MRMFILRRRKSTFACYSIIIIILINLIRIPFRECRKQHSSWPRTVSVAPVDPLRPEAHISNQQEVLECCTVHTSAGRCPDDGSHNISRCETNGVFPLYSSTNAKRTRLSLSCCVLCPILAGMCPSSYSPLYLIL